MKGETFKERSFYSALRAARVLLKDTSVSTGVSTQKEEHVTSAQPTTTAGLGPDRRLALGPAGCSLARPLACRERSRRGRGVARREGEASSAPLLGDILREVLMLRRRTRWFCLLHLSQECSAEIRRSGRGYRRTNLLKRVSLAGC